MLNNYGIKNLPIIFYQLCLSGIICCNVREMFCLMHWIKWYKKLTAWQVWMALFKTQLILSCWISLKWTNYGCECNTRDIQGTLDIYYLFIYPKDILWIFCEAFERNMAIITRHSWIKSFSYLKMVEKNCTTLCIESFLFLSFPAFIISISLI